MRIAAPLLDRIADNVELDGECIAWTGFTSKGGHGKISRPGGQGTARVHRVVWEATVGPIPDGLVLHHICENPRCVNVDHLELVTPGEHRQRHLKTHCVHGHEYTSDNTYRRPDGSRLCRACMRAHALDHYYRTKP